jgi:(R)-amidase
VRLRLVQTASVPGDHDANADKAAAAIADATGADLVVFPETFLCGYDPPHAAERALPADGPHLRRLATVAAQADTAVAIGFAERAGDRVFNSLACIERDGRLAAVYRKTHLFGAEARYFDAGDRLHVVSLAGVDVGPLICFDMEFPEPARALARTGARLLLCSSANFHPLGPDHTLAARARALDNRRPLAYCNRVGAEAGLRFVGESGLVGPGGEFVTRAAHDGEVRLDVNVDLDADPSPELDYLAYARPGLPVERRASSLPR